MAFGDRLKALLASSGLTEYALAKQAGLSKQAVNKLVSGTRDPTWETVQRLAHALGVDCTAFADDDLPFPPRTSTGKPGRPRKVEAEVPPVPPAEEEKPTKGRRKGKT
jgi:transcriptional regulator with XRE-family HTH domain